MTPDLLNGLINFASILDPLLMLMVAGCTVMGVIKVAGALIALYRLAENDGKWLGKDEGGIGGVVSSMLIGGVLVAPIFFVQVFGNTLFNVSVNGSGMLYQAAGMTESQRQAVRAILGLFAIAGFFAFIRGWLVIDRYMNNVTREGMGEGIVTIVFGVAMVYMDVILDAFGELTGFNFMQVLLF